MSNDTSTLPGFDPADGRPLPYRRAPGMRLATGAEGEEGTEYYLRAANRQLFILAEQEAFLWEALDGSRSFAAIEQAFRARFAIGLASAAFAKFIGELLEAGALERVEPEPSAKRVTLAGPRMRKIELPDADTAAATVEDGEVASPPPSRPAHPGLRLTLRAFKNPISTEFRNSGRWLSAMARAFWPIRYISWALAPMVLIGILIIIKHEDQYLADAATIYSTLPIWPCLWIAEHITTWSARVVEGTVIYGFGGIVTHTHLRLFMMFIRIKFEEGLVESMPRRNKLWIAASPLIWRLFCFSACQIAWLELRSAHPFFAQLLMIEGAMGLMSFFVSALPMLPLYGYRFLTILLHQETLYARAFRLLAIRLAGRPAPYTMTTAERWGLLSMAVGTALFAILYVGNVLFQSNRQIALLLNGFGGWVVLAIMASTVLYFWSLFRFAGRVRALQRAARVRDGGRDIPPRAVDAGGSDAAPNL
jgi:hypothetical protein